MLVAVLTLFGAAALSRILGVDAAFHDVGTTSFVERLVWALGALALAVGSAATLHATSVDEASVAKSGVAWPCEQRTMRRVAALCLSVTLVETVALIVALTEAISLVDALIIVGTLRPLLLVVYATATPAYRVARGKL